MRPQIGTSWDTGYGPCTTAELQKRKRAVPPPYRLREWSSRDDVTERIVGRGIAHRFMSKNIPCLCQGSTPSCAAAKMHAEKNTWAGRSAPGDCFFQANPDIFGPWSSLAEAERHAQHAGTHGRPRLVKRPEPHRSHACLDFPDPASPGLTRRQRVNARCCFFPGAITSPDTNALSARDVPPYLHSPLLNLSTWHLIRHLPRCLCVL